MLERRGKYLLEAESGMAYPTHTCMSKILLQIGNKFGYPILVLVIHLGFSRLSPAIFGCVTFVHIYAHQRNKLDLELLNVCLLGIHLQDKGMCYHPAFMHFLQP